MNSQIVAILITVLLAISGYLFKYFYELQIQKRNNYLKFINERLEYLYGPLYIMTVNGKIAYDTFTKVLKKDNDPNLNISLSELEKNEWILWVREVFHKNNLEIEKIIKEKAYLIIEEKIPNCIIDFITHLSNNKILIKKWDEQKFEQIFSIIDYPDDFLNYAESSYIKLKSEQLRYTSKLRFRY